MQKYHVDMYSLKKVMYVLMYDTFFKDLHKAEGFSYPELLDA